MNKKSLAAGVALAVFGSISSLVLVDLPATTEISPLAPLEAGVTPSEPLPPALQELIAGAEATSDSTRIEAEKIARDLVRSIETSNAGTPGTPPRMSHWKRLHPEIDRRFAAMADAGRRANIAFVHFLVRNGLEPDSLPDEVLAGAFDDLSELLERRDGELLVIQSVDVDSRTQELDEEIDELSLEVMERYRELERELGRRFGGTDQRPTGAAAFAAAACSR